MQSYLFSKHHTFTKLEYYKIFHFDYFHEACQGKIGREQTQFIGTIEGEKRMGERKNIN